MVAMEMSCFELHAPSGTWLSKAMCYFLNHIAEPEAEIEADTDLPRSVGSWKQWVPLPVFRAKDVAGSSADVPIFSCLSDAALNRSWLGKVVPATSTPCLARSGTSSPTCFPIRSTCRIFSRHGLRPFVSLNTSSP